MYHGGGQEVRHRHPAALHQRLRGGFPAPARRPSATRWPRSRTSARRRSRASSRSARPTAPSRTSPTSPAAATPRRSTSARWRPWPPPAPSTALEPNRALVHGNVEPMLAFANRLATNAAQGTGDLFGGGAAGAAADRLRPLKAWTPMERLQHEFEAVGFFLSGHPLDAYARVLAKLGIVSLRRAGGARGPRRRRRAGSPASSSRRASAARRRATSSPSPCSPSRPASSRP